jgi:predicted transglutaminase-like cysteine proteinase
MNKKTIATLTAMLGLCSTNYIFANAASAQMSSETQQLINETNALVNQATQFLNDSEQQRQQEMNALSSLCSSGDNQACMEYKIRLNAEDRAVENYTQILRNRRLCGSSVC